MAGAFVGGRLRQLREERRLTQADLARQLEISASYLNQLEHNSRPLTVPVLLKISDVFGVDASFFASQDTTRLIAELSEVMVDAEVGVRASTGEITELATGQPEIARALVTLHRRYRQVSDQLAQQSDDGVATASMPHEEARDFFYRRSNYIHELDAPAELLAEQMRRDHPTTTAAIIDRLRRQHGVRLVERDQDQLGALHRFDPDTRVLALASHLRPGQRAFKLAGQLAFMEYAEVLQQVADDAGLPPGETRSLVIIGLANYFAAALLLPYEPFRAAAENLRYDLERLISRFDASFETVCHRLSTLQRPRARGVPFSLVRVDRAGNVSKMLSSTSFHFSRSGGTCPLWGVYEAFASPTKILTQVAAMPDGRRYLWIARTVTRSPGRWGAPDKTFALGLGCEVRHAGRLVYSAGLDLENRAAATPIGMGCKACPRIDCSQRAFPPFGRRLAIDRYRSTFVPYPVAADPT